MHELGRLHKALQQVLAKAIKLGGSSVSDYVDADGVRGFFQLEHKVYGRGWRGVQRLRDAAEEDHRRRPHDGLLPALPALSTSSVDGLLCCDGGAHTRVIWSSSTISTE